MTPQFIIPAGFDTRDYLSYSLRRQHDCARWLVNTILRKLARRPDHSTAPVRLHAQHLKRMMGRRYVDIIRALMDGDVLHRTPYAVGSRSFGYCLDRRFAEQPHIRRDVEDSRLLRRIEELQQESRAKKLELFKPIHRQLAQLQRQLTIDSVEANRALAELPPESNPYDVQGILFRDIAEHRFRLTVGPVSHRVFNSITSMCRPVRKALRIHGSPLVGIDLKCCQPALLSMLIQGSCETTQIAKSGNHSKVHPCVSPETRPLADPSLWLRRDVRDFACRTSDGSLYDFLLEQVPGLSRDQLKRRFLCDVLAKKGKYDSAVEKAVAKLWPSVLEFVRHTNRFDRAELIRALQRAEASLVIEQVCSRIVDYHPGDFAITIHDAIYSHPEHAWAIEQAFESAFDEMGFSIGLEPA